MCALDKELAEANFKGYGLLTELPDVSTAQVGRLSPRPIVGVSNCPMHSVGEQGRSAGDLGLQVFLGQAKPLSDDRAKLRKRVVTATGQDTERRRHQ
jgi:hypothetical protein